MDNKINFTSRIYFVQPKDFQRMWRARLAPHNIADEPWTFADAKFSDNVLGTLGINTCTSVNLAKAGRAVLYHLATCQKNFDDLESLGNKFKNLPANFDLDSVLIIGSKSPTTPGLDSKFTKNLSKQQHFDVLSQPLFEKVVSVCKKFQPTIFQGHSGPNTGSCYIYDVKNDNYFIMAARDIFDKDNTSVKNWKDLRKTFNRVEISPKDTVDFIV